MKQPVFSKVSTPRPKKIEMEPKDDILHPFTPKQPNLRTLLKAKITRKSVSSEIVNSIKDKIRRV